MTLSIILTFVFVGASAILTYLMKIWRFGPFLERDEPNSVSNEPINASTSLDNSKTEQTASNVVNTPQTPISSPTAHPNATLTNLIAAQTVFEGANPANCNPLNFRYHYGGYLPIYGKVGCSKGGFAMFKDNATGILYARNAIKQIFRNHPSLTIATYIAGDGNWSGFAPASDKNPVQQYASFIADRLGVTADFPVKDIHMV